MVHVNSSKSKISFVPNQSQVHMLQQAIKKKMSIGYKIGAVHITYDCLKQRITVKHAEI